MLRIVRRESLPIVVVRVDIHRALVFERTGPAVPAVPRHVQRVPLGLVVQVEFGVLYGQPAVRRKEHLYAQLPGSHSGQEYAFVAQPKVVGEVAEAVAVGCPGVVPECVGGEALLEDEPVVDGGDGNGIEQSEDL